MFNEFEMMKKILKTVLRTFPRTYKTVSRQLCRYRYYKNKILQFSDIVIVATRTIKLLAVATPPSIYQRAHIKSNNYTPDHNHILIGHLLEFNSKYQHAETQKPW